MRNIEEIAAEEEARIGAIRKAGFQRVFLLSGIALGLWGWFLFARGSMGPGALAVLASLVLLLAAWEGFVLSGRSFSSTLAAGAAGAGALALYTFTHLPSFFWGSDPSYWLAVHTGAVTEPLWSPLPVLSGQSFCSLFPKRQFLILPELSAAALAAALFFGLRRSFDQIKNRSAVTLSIGLLTGFVLAASAPFWEAATRGGGLAAGLGLLLFLLQRNLISMEERSWKALSLLQGLLWCVHPSWGLMGTVVHLGSLDAGGRRWFRNSFCFLIGLTPYLWVRFRAGKVFPSWGGEEPFREFFREWRDLWADHFTGWTVGSASASYGWVLALLVLAAFTLWLLHSFKWRAGGKPLFPAVDFWVWILAGTGGILFFSPSSGALGPSAVWFALGTGEWFLKLLDRGMEKRKGALLSGPRLAGGLALVLAASLGAGWLTGQSFFRGQYYFPLEHALNLLRTVSGTERTLLVCGDPFEASACREARLMEPLALSTVILEERYLGRKWYVAECIGNEPEILFSGLEGTPEDLLRSLVENNLDRWKIHWALSALPAGWKDPKAFPTVLTQEFKGKTSGAGSGESIQYRYDLTALPQNFLETDRLSYRYFFRYVSGFNELGKALMGLNRYSDAIHSFQRAQKLEPAFVEPQTYLSQMYSEKKILEAAQLEFERTIKTHPGRIEAAMKGLEKAQKNKDEADIVTSLDEMIRLNAQLGDAQYQLSVIYDRQGKFRESKILLESSVQSNPKLIEAQLTLGRLMARKGNRLKAEDAFRAVLGVNPENKEAQVELWKLLNK